MVKHCLTPLSPLLSLLAAVFQHVIGSGVVLNPATTPLHTATAPLYTDLAGGEPLSMEYSVDLVAREASDDVAEPSEWCKQAFAVVL